MLIDEVPFSSEQARYHNHRVIRPIAWTHRSRRQLAYRTLKMFSSVNALGLLAYLLGLGCGDSMARPGAVAEAAIHARVCDKGQADFVWKHDRLSVGANAPGGLAMFATGIDARGLGIFAASAFGAAFHVGSWRDLPGLVSVV
jgi:hypothetical protein